MNLSASYLFDSSPDRVWDLLMDPNVIASCIPGCERFVPEGEDRYRMQLTVALSAVTGTYDGLVTLSDKNAPLSYVLTGEGRGRAGFVNGKATISLRPEGGGTTVDVTATVQTGGTIARVGQRLIGGASKMMMDRFFACLQSKVPRPRS